MSYEPQLIIRKKHLCRKKATTVLDKEQYSNNVVVEKIARYLISVRDGGSIKFGSLELVLCCPEGTIFNMQIRHKLDELKIEYEIVD